MLYKIFYFFPGKKNLVWKSSYRLKKEVKCRILISSRTKKTIPVFLLLFRWKKNEDKKKGIVAFFKLLELYSFGDMRTPHTIWRVVIRLEFFSTCVG